MGGKDVLMSAYAFGDRHRWGAPHRRLPKGPRSCPGHQHLTGEPMMTRLPILAFLLSLSHDGPPQRFLCVTEEHLTTGVVVRAEPAPGADTVMVIGSGRVVVEFGTVDGWVFGGVQRAGGRDGYVPASALRTTDLDGLPCGS